MTHISGWQSGRFLDRILGSRQSAGSGLETGEQSIRTNTIHGLLNSGVVNLVGPFTAIFAVHIGATPVHIAMLTSAPAIVSLIVMIPGARFLDRSSRKGRATIWWMFANRLFYLLLVSVTFFAPREEATVFVVLLALMNLPGAISNIAWQAVISKIIPPEKRSRAFAARNRIMNIFGTGLTVAAGIFLDHARFPIGYQATFVAAFLLSIAELAVFRRIARSEDASAVPSGQTIAVTPLVGPIATPPQATAERRYSLLIRFNRAVSEVLRGSMGEILSEKRFLRYLLISMLFYLAWQTPWPLFSWFQVKTLHANNLWVSILALLNTGGALVGYGFWQRMLDRRGNLFTLFVSSLPIFLVPLVYAFSRSLSAIGVANLIIGAIFSGVNLALFNTTLEMTPESKKATFLAYYTTGITIASVIAPLIGVGLLRFMDFHWAFLVCAAFRLVGSLGFLGLHRYETRARDGNAAIDPRFLTGE